MTSHALGASAEKKGKRRGEGKGEEKEGKRRGERGELGKLLWTKVFPDPFKKL